MLTKQDFINYVLGLRTPPARATTTSALPGELDDFDEPTGAPQTQPDPSDFARGLLERLFGDAPERPLDEILIPGDDVERLRLTGEYAPGAHYWRKTAQRPFHIVLVRLKNHASTILRSSPRRTIKELQLLDDELHRRLQDGLAWFERGGPRRTTEMPQGAQNETLYVVTITDDRPEGQPRQLIAFGTKAAATDALEAFLLREEVLDWDRALAREHLSGFYARHLRPLAKGASWQDAFVTSEERTCAHKLLAVCTAKRPDTKRLADTIRDLLDEIAGSFGLLPMDKSAHRLEMRALPDTHSIAIDPKAARKKGFKNSLQGVRIFDRDQRLLGYIVYIADNKQSAALLTERLRDFNHFHNVLVIYPDLTDPRLELWQGCVPLEGRLRAGQRASRFDGEGGVIQLLSRFFSVSRTEIQDSKALAAELGWRAQHLCALALDQLATENKRRPKDDTTPRPLRDLLEVFNKALVTLNDEQFADAYAQTLTYGLLAARWMSAERDDLPFARSNVEKLLPSTSPFLHDLFTRLISDQFDDNLLWLIDDIIGLLGRTTVSKIRFGKNDPSIHFYEDFLDEYNKSLRAERGVYYTPDEVVSYIVRTAHAALQDPSRFNLPLGLADTTTWADFAKQRKIPVPPGIDPSQPFVQILDPACGTGTFPLRIIETIHETMLAHYRAHGLDPAVEWPQYVRQHLLPRVSGFELMMAPYIVAHLRLGLALQQTGFEFTENDRLQIFLTNTLEMHTDAQLLTIGVHVAAEAQKAEFLKYNAPISVILGNPPYEREPAESTGASHKGGWIRSGWNTWRSGVPPLEDLLKSTRDAGAGGHLKNIYNLYVYFWRWAIWRAFDRFQTPGIVSLITASSYLRGPGFVGMRELFRKTADEIFIFDLEGDQRGTRVTENVFCITIPVCVGTMVLATIPNRTAPAASCYKRIIGTRGEKLKASDGSRKFADLSWSAAPSGWQDVLMTGAECENSAEGDPMSFAYSEWPVTLDIFPWQQSGCKAGRTWVIGETHELLERRWSALVAVTGDDRVERFKNSPTGQKADKAPVRLPPFGGRDTPILRLAKSAPPAAIERFGARTFDRQWIFADSRLLDRAGPPNWYVRSGKQTYLTSLLSGVLGKGPAATASAFVPDLHHFRGSYGGKDVVPLWRDPEGKQPNIAGAFFKKLTETLGADDSKKPKQNQLQAVDVFAYAYAVLANPGYVQRFEEELQVPGPRLPITKDPALFRRGAALGRELLRWHTYGERLREPGDNFTLTGAARLLQPIPSAPSAYPEKHRYDPKTRTLHVGDGQIGPVSPEVIAFSVSGLVVVKSWLDYRMKKAAGKKSSPLDEIRPERWTEELTRELLELLWVLQWTLEQYPTLDTWLDQVLESELFTADEIPPPTDEERKEPKFERSRQENLL